MTDRKSQTADELFIIQSRVVAALLGRFRERSGDDSRAFLHSATRRDVRRAWARKLYRLITVLSGISHRNAENFI